SRLFLFVIGFSVSDLEKSRRFAVSPNTEPNHTEQSARRPHRFQELRSGLQSQKLINRVSPGLVQMAACRCSLQIPGEIWMLGFRVTSIFLLFQARGFVESNWKVRLCWSGCRTGQKDLLEANIQHLRELSFRVRSIYQFISELLIQPDNEAVLQARVGRNVDGVDLNLYYQSLQLLRQFQAHHLKNPDT
ncbi:unnamed protein product, partial [Prunus brigantina]